MKHFLANIDNPTVLDVGANEGQSVELIRNTFPTAIIHSFEPSPATFGMLCKNCSGLKGVSPWNVAVGAGNEPMKLLENVESGMTSFLELGSLGWGAVKKATTVEMVTLDAFTEKNGIAKIHILKCDTQGFEVEVLNGAKRLMNEGRIALIYLEIIFSDMYKGIAPFDELYKLLRENGFLLVGFYSPHFQKNLLSWTDALFINAKFLEQAPQRVG